MDKVIFKCVFGSHLYGLNNPASDRDYKAIVLPSKQDVILQKADWCRNESTGQDHQKNTSDDIDMETFSLHRFIKLASEGQMVALDMLHCNLDSTIEMQPEWQVLRKNRHRFYTKNMAAFLGYVKKQAAKYGVKGSRLAAMSEALGVIEEAVPFTIEGDSLHDPKLWQEVHTRLGDLDMPINEHASWVEQDGSNGEPQKFYELCGSKLQSTLTLQMAHKIITGKYDKYGERARQAEKNEGIDWKAVSHALRACYQLKDIYTIGDIQFPFEKERKDYLLKVKLGVLNYKDDVGPHLESLVEEVMELAEKSHYPEEVDMGFWEDWLCRLYWN